MTAHATLLPGLDFVKVEVEELHYGKLVVAPGGHVPAGEGYATTYRTKNFAHADLVLPTRLLNGAMLQPEHIEKPFQKRGALFFRPVSETLVAMGARFRSEGGEGRSGRTYLQATILQVRAPQGYASVPGFIPLLKDIPVEPDLVADGKCLGAVAFEYEDIPPPDLWADLHAFGPERQDRFCNIVHAMRTPEPVVIGSDRSDDLAQCLSAFLQDVDLALRVMSRGGERVRDDFWISCGLSADVVRRGLMLSSVTGSTSQSRTRWSDVLDMIDASAEPSPGDDQRGSRSATGKKSFGKLTSDLKAVDTRHPTTYGEYALKAKSASSGKTTASSGGYFNASGVQPNRDPPVERSIDGHGGRLDDAQHDPIEIGKDASARRTPPPLTREGYALITFADRFRDSCRDPAEVGNLLGLFDDQMMLAGLKNWDPFDPAHPPSQEHALLALLLGLTGNRKDLLERFTFAEFFNIWPQIEALPPNKTKDRWVDRLIQRMDDRIDELGTLTAQELSLLFEYETFYNGDPSRFNDRSKEILKADYLYQTIRDDGRYDSHEEQRTVHAAWVHMHRRYTWLNDSSRDTIYGTFRVVPNLKSMFQLAPREDVIRSSKVLLSDEVAEIERVHARFSPASDARSRGAGSR